MPRADKAAKIAKAIGVSVESLFDDSSPWPPPKASTPEMTDSEIVEDLARRREMVRRDIRTITKRLADVQFLQAVEPLASASYHSSRPLTPNERARVTDMFMDFQRLAHLHERLNALDPDRVHPHEPSVMPLDLVRDFPTLTEYMQQALARRDGGNLFGKGDEPGEVIAFTDNGAVVPWARCDAMSPFQQKRFSPILDSLRSGAPHERHWSVQLGQHLPREYRDWICSKSRHDNAFGYRVPPEHDGPGLPAGTVVVCEPGEPPRDGEHLVAVLFDRGRREGVYYLEASALRPAAPGAEPIPLTDDAVIYSVTEIYPTAASVSPSADDRVAVADELERLKSERTAVRQRALKALADKRKRKRKPAPRKST